MTGWHGIRRIAAVACAAALLFSLTACTTPPDVTGGLPTQVRGALPDATTAQLRAATEQAITVSGSSGAIVGVWAPWSGSWTAGLGTTTRGGPEKMTTSLSYRAAGLTTAMTCTVLLGLVDKGTVSLSDPVKKYLPRMVGVGDIQLGQLCNGTSGLAPLGNAVRVQFIANPERDWPDQELIGEGLAGATFAAPGSGFQHSEPAVDLLGLVVTQVTGKTWRELYDNSILTPLHTTATSLPNPSTDGIRAAHPDGYAHALNNDGSPVCEAPADVTKLSNSVGGVSTGAISNLEDTKIITQALAKGLLVSKEASTKQWETVSRGPNSPAWNAEGLGGEVAGPLRGVVGVSPGYLTASYTEPKSGLTVAVMLNDSTDGIGIVRLLALRLATIAATAPAKRGDAPTITFPWSEQDVAGGIAGSAVCPPTPPAK